MPPRWPQGITFWFSGQMGILTLLRASASCFNLLTLNNSEANVLLLQLSEENSLAFPSPLFLFVPFMPIKAPGSTRARTFILSEDHPASPSSRSWAGRRRQPRVAVSGRNTRWETSFQARGRPPLFSPSLLAALAGCVLRGGGDGGRRTACGVRAVTILLGAGAQGTGPCE